MRSSHAPRLLAAVSCAAIGAAFALPRAAHAEAPFAFDSTPGQLPKTVIPIAYRIAITPDLQKLTLTGSETIDVTVRTPTNTMTLSQAGLKITQAKLDDSLQAQIAEDEKAQTATFTFPKEVTAGPHSLVITYTGPIPNTPNGIYYDDYKTRAGAARRMLVTQFEVADARRMFPGWDEPAFKATFQLTATLPKDLVVVSNTPVLQETDVERGLKRVAFTTTPRMSTYLLALVAGDMGAIHDEAAGVKLGAYAATGEQDQADYALSVAKQVLPYYNSYFGVDYPLPKMDLLAIPGNYAAGAMENWGAITAIDDSMLFDPKVSSPHTREEINITIAHEMAHQWSGDLVTMGWWNDIWLNEGFATWMQTKATDHFNPSWQIWPREHDSHEQAMAQDALPSTHPIQQVIHNVSEANSAFDRISYQKGAAVIRMIEDWLGADTFRDGMRRYMKAHQYGNATSADLWAALGAASGKDVAHVAASFTEQPGIPLIEVTRHCDGGKASLRLTADRFTVHDPHPKKLTWSVPVTIGLPGESGAAPRHLLLGAAGATVDLPSCDAAAKLNWGENGYYRVQYDAASLAALAHAWPQLGAADRANLLGDQYALFVGGRAPLTGYLGLLGNLHSETSVAVWEDTLSHLRRLQQLLAGTPVADEFGRYAAKIVRPEFDRLGWDPKPGESFLDTLIRPKLIAALGQFNDPETVADAKTRFAAFLDKPSSLAPALRDPVAGIVGHHADQQTYDALRKLGETATDTEDKLRYFDAMATAQDPALLKQTVAFADSGAMPNGRIAYMLMAASTGSGHADELFSLVQPEEATLNKHLPPGGVSPTTLVASAIGSANPDTARQLLADKESNADPGSHIWAVRVADIVGTNADLRARAQPAVADWLKAHG